jgi:ubiquinone biosynthesis protein
VAEIREDHRRRARPAARGRNASQLRRNFADGRLLIVPEVYWEWCNREVMAMERIDGIPVNATGPLRAAEHRHPEARARRRRDLLHPGVPRRLLPRRHAPRATSSSRPTGRYCGVDFGIMGTLSDADKGYLATNFMAFFHRDLPSRALAHVEAGWVPRTRASTSSRARSARCASRSSTSR